MKETLRSGERGMSFVYKGGTRLREVLPWFEEQRQEDVQVRACFPFPMAQRAREEALSDYSEN